VPALSGRDLCDFRKLWLKPRKPSPSKALHGSHFPPTNDRPSQELVRIVKLVTLASGLADGLASFP